MSAANPPIQARAAVERAYPVSAFLAFRKEEQMSEAALTAGPSTAVPESSIRRHRTNFFMWFVHALPFLILGIGAVVGMAATTVTGQPKRLYWSIFTPVAALVCVLEGWRIAKTAGDYTAIFFKQLFQ